MMAARLPAAAASEAQQSVTDSQTAIDDESGCVGLRHALTYLHDGRKVACRVAAGGAGKQQSQEVQTIMHVARSPPLRTSMMAASLPAVVQGQMQYSVVGHNLICKQLSVVFNVPLLLLAV
jgi:hypothetical protein